MKKTALSRLLPCVLAFCLAAGCATQTVPEVGSKLSAAHRGAKPELDRVGRSPNALLSYYQALSLLSPGELLQEKKRLHGNAPDTLLRQAMLLGHPRQPAPDLRRANAILGDLLRARDSVSYYLRPMARILADSYSERLRQEQQIAKQNAQLEKQYQRLLEAQRRAAELQEKLNGLANIERSLPRARTVGPGATNVQTK
ncbi:MAG: hypothetical protein LBB55_05870 [Zoogloeaceae bacterium]|jgi:hypothetical protein|nr:hypothetical protein [Zoogloeaceae bacterium]